MTELKQMSGAGVRRKFLDYFASKGHTIVKSSPLVPGNDPTLLFTNAGMVQFKETFLGMEKRSYTRATSSQKCLRVSGKHNDLESVGRTARHHTFFEMLGNFSFGDYFKEDAIKFGWEFITEVIGLPKDKLYVTVYLDDDEAAELWHTKAGVPKDRIYRYGDKDNFWSMGDTGPCGPCSEIHYDRGEEYKCSNPDCWIDCECDRFLELWNLVFMQYNRDSSGKKTPLPNPSIDTGMGLERLVSVLQGKHTNYETDLILPVIRHMERLTEHEYGEGAGKKDVSFRVIGDHARATAFLIAEGVIPSNEGRGYVLRRVLRRGLRHGFMLDVKEPFMYRLVDTVMEIMKDDYPELMEHAHIIRDVTKKEEESFRNTLHNGIPMLHEIIEREKEKDAAIIPGVDLFSLYDTFGFPMDLARDIAEDAGMGLDMAGFNTLMEEQKEKAREGGKTKFIAKDFTGVTPILDYDETEFTGYSEQKITTKVVDILVSGKRVQSLSEGKDAAIIMEKSPFYAESGGQVGDKGLISNESFSATVLDVVKGGGFFEHRVTITHGAVKVGDTVTAEVDVARRNDIRRNHSATHLLHAALRQVLGTHVKQGGSMVAPDRLRFDYTHYTAPTKDELEKIESLVNEKIMENTAVATDVKSMDDAVKDGAMALFGEKYGDKVRVVTMGDFSKELCGGTHTGATGDIGLFRIISEGGVASGLRRIEAVTGWGAIKLVKEKEEELTAIAEALKSPPVDLPEKVRKQLDRVRELERENKKLKDKIFSGGKAETGDVVDVAGVKLLATLLDGADAEAMRSFVDAQRNRLGSAVVVAGAEHEGKAMIAVGVTKDLTAKLNAGKIVKELAAMVGGGGGGRPDFAQAGGKNPEKLKEAIDAAQGVIEKFIK